MATDGNDRRDWRGPRALGALLPRLTRPAFRRRSPAGALLMAEWPAAIGPALAAATEPLRLAQGTLTIACTGAVALELTHLAPQLIARLNAHAGRIAVTRLRFVQHPNPRPAPPRAPTPAPLPTAVRGALDTLPEGPLRDALEKLGGQVYRRRG